KSLLVNHVPHGFEPPPPVCDMKSGRWREEVVKKRDCKTPEIHEIAGEKTQKEQYRSKLCFREAFT
ncbi:MAG: hypothetical protein ABEI52_03015, partial [Halobacteriaceae archaeon]